MYSPNDKTVQGLVHQRAANLKVYPAACTIDDAIQHISLGDLHGNTMKLIFTLIQEGFLRLENDQKDYDELYKIYNAPYSPTNIQASKEKFRRFKEIIEHAKPVNTKRALTLIGDVLCDRGVCDYFTLLVLGKVKSLGIELSCLYGNHDSEFLQALEKATFTGEHGLYTGRPEYPTEDQGRSLKGVKTYIDAGLIDLKELKDLTDTVYIPMVKAIDYTLSEDKQHITLLMHAPVGFEVIEGLAQYFRVAYDESSIDSLTKTIDGINLAFNAVLRNKQLSSLVQQDMTSILAMSASDQNDCLVNNNIPVRFPLYRLAWQRTTDAVSTRPWATIVHGHNGHAYRASPDHVNLDTDFGKTPGLPDCKTDDHKRKHLIRHTSEKTAYQLRKNAVPRSEALPSLSATSILKPNKSKATDTSDVVKIRAIIWTQGQAIQGQIGRLEKRVARDKRDSDNIRETITVLKSVKRQLRSIKATSRFDYLQQAQDIVEPAIPKIRDARGKYSLHRLLQSLSDWLSGLLGVAGPAQTQRHRFYKTTTEAVLTSVTEGIDLKKM